MFTINVVHEVRWLPNDVEAKLSQLASGLTQVITALNNLDGKVNSMSSNLDRIEKEAADAAENVGLVRAAVDGLNTVVSDLKAEIQTLKDQVAQGQLDQARLDAAAAVFEKADDDLDAIVVPPAPAEGGGTTEPTEGGTPA